MSSASLDEVWGRDTVVETPTPPSENRDVSARVVQNDEPSDIDRLRMDIMERMSTIFIGVMGVLTLMLVHVERLRREVRLLREGILRPR
jgi:hypothetical protein